MLLSFVQSYSGAIYIVPRQTPLQVMTVVKALVKQGITICATIHCPPPHTFTLFDRALIMQRGRVAYFGPMASPPSATSMTTFPRRVYYRVAGPVL